MAEKQHADIIDVARAAGVSPATVSRAFNHPSLVRPDTRARVQRAVDDLGYIRNRAASAMHGEKSGAVGLIVPTIDNAIFSNLIQSFSTALQDAGQSLLIATHGYDQAAEHQLLRKFLEHRVDGVALIGLSHQDRTFDLIAARETPAVLMWSFGDAPRLPCIGADNAKAGALAARHICDLGHKAIATVFPPIEGNDRAERRFDGAMAVLGAAGVAPPNAWRRESRYHIGQAMQSALELLSADERPTAILAGNDVIARGVISAAMELGLRLPDDLTVVGIGDFSGSAELTPALTTVRIDSVGVGLAAAEALLVQMGARDGQVGSREIPVELKIRRTSAPPGWDEADKRITRNRALEKNIPP